MAATDKRLGLLHSEIAEVMAAMIRPREIKEYDDEGEVTHVRMEYPSPAVLAVAVKFLKDNSISADIENDDALKDLKAAMDMRRQRRTVGDKDMDEAAAVARILQ